MLYIKKNSIISNYSRIYPFSIITNSRIDSFSYIGYCCRINNAVIGKYCSISQNVKMGLGKHPTNFISTSPIFYAPKNALHLKICKYQKYNEFSQIVIGNDVWIGANVFISDGITISDGAIIGANSVVTKNVEPYTIVGGIPAREIRKRFSPEIIDNLLNLKWWNYSIRKLNDESVFQLFSKEVDADLIKEIQKRLLKS